MYCPPYWSAKTNRKLNFHQSVHLRVFYTVVCVYMCACLCELANGFLFTHLSPGAAKGGSWWGFESVYVCVGGVLGAGEVLGCLGAFLWHRCRNGGAKEKRACGGFWH